MNDGMQEKYVPANFLIVDDDEVSIKTIIRAMKKNNIANPTHIASDGIEAMQILNRSMDANTGMPPFIVTLDLNMPRMNGIEFLESIRKHPVYKKLIVFVLTTSDCPTDIDAAYSKNIAGYIVKDNAVETFAEAMRILSDFSKMIVYPDT
jgi:CheY-like chemotaxis protein